MKKLISIVMAVCLVLSTLPVLALSDSGGENLALHKKVTASNYLSGHEPKNLTDGDVVSGWSPDVGVNHWAMVDLGAEYQINKVVIEMRKDFNQPETRQGFEVRASNSSDMSDYVVLAKQGASPVEHAGRFIGQVVEPGSYRYVQVIKTDGMYFYMTEILVYGSTGGSDDGLQSAPTFTDMEGSAEKDMVSLLTLLGIMQGYDDNTFRPDKQITRAEACQMITKLLGLDSSGATSKMFTDVPLTYWGAAPIQLLSGLGAVSGMGDGTFMPEEKVSYGQFVKMLLSSLGYEQLAQVRGGYPTGYFIMAAFHGIELSGVSADKPLTRKEAVRLLYRALDVNMAKPVRIEDGHVIYESNEDKTLLNSVFDVYRYRGTVSATEYSALFGGKRLSKGHISVGTEEYLTGMDTFEALGRDVNYYVKENEGAKEDILLFYEIRKQDETLTVFAKDILPGNDTDSLSYYTDEEQKHSETVSIAKAADVYKNEEYVRDANENTIRPKTGCVRLVDANGDGDYDHIFVYEYENLVVSNASVENDELALNGLYGNYCNVRLAGSATRVRLTDKNGKTISAGAIETNDIASVYANSDNSFVWIAVSGDKRSGTVEALLDDGVLCDGEELEYAPSYLEALKNNAYGSKTVNVGETLTLLLDVEGKIAAVVAEDGSAQGADLKYGYLAALDLSKGIGDNLILMMADVTGNLKEFSCAEKLKLNGVATDHAKAATALKGSAHNGTFGQLIRYRSNSEGKISAIYTSDYASEDYGIVLGSAGTEKEYYYHQPTKGMYLVSGGGAAQYFISGNTLMFTVPRYSASASSEMQNAKHYSVITGNSFGNYVHYDAEAYNADEAGVADVIVNYVAPLSSDDGSDALKETHGPVLLVERLTESVNEDGETYGKLYAYADGGDKVNYLFDKSQELDQFRFIGATGETKHSLSCGDVIRCSVSGNTITSAIILFRAAAPMAFSNGKSWDDDSVYPPVTRTVGGVVKNIYGNYMQLALGDPATGNVADFSTESYDYTGACAYIYDSAKKKLSEISVLDLPQYTYQNDSSARVFVRTNLGAVKLLLIVK